MRPRSCAASTRRFSSLGAAIGGVRRIEQRAVIAPAAIAGELGDRHELDRGDAELLQMIEA